MHPSIHGYTRPFKCSCNVKIFIPTSREQEVQVNSSFSFKVCPRCSKDEGLIGLFASQLADRVRSTLPADSLIVGILGAGSELGEQMAKTLGVRSEILHIYPLFWPPASNSVVGAVSGLTDITYIDYKALNGAVYSSQALMAQIQAVKLQCMKEAIGKELVLSHRNWSATTIFLCCCAHAPIQVLEAALQNLAIKPPLGIYLVTPFVSREVKSVFANRIDDFIFLGEHLEYDSLAQY